MMIPRYDQFSLSVKFEAFAPLEHSLNRLHIIHRNFNVEAFHIDLCCESGWVLAFVIEVKDKHAINASCDQHVLLIVEVSVCYQAHLGHIVWWFHHDVQFV